jgi:hypothetical protein
MTPCGSYKNRRFRGSYRLHLQGVRVRAGTERSGKLLYMQRLKWKFGSCNWGAGYTWAFLLVLCWLASYTLKMEAIRSSETSVLIRATRRHFPEDDNHHRHRHGNLKSYVMELIRTSVDRWQTVFKRPVLNIVLAKGVQLSGHQDLHVKTLVCGEKTNLRDALFYRIFDARNK